MVKLSKKLLTVDIYSGSALVAQNLVTNTNSKELNNLILVCDTKDSIVFCSDNKINSILCSNRTKKF